MNHQSKQLTLFGTDSFKTTLSETRSLHQVRNPCDMVPGLICVRDFIDPGSESEIIDQIDNYPWSEELARRVQHYGYKYDYKARRINPEMYVGELPHWMHLLGVQLYESGYFAAIPDQVIVNEYLPGQGITPHVDCEPCFGDTVVSLSLLS